MATTQYEYALAYSTAVTIDLASKPYTPADFATATGGVNNVRVQEVVWQSQPSFSTVTLVFPDAKNSIAGPVRRPKES